MEHSIGKVGIGAYSSPVATPHHFVTVHKAPGTDDEIKVHGYLAGSKQPVLGNDLMDGIVEPDGSLFYPRPDRS
jgi:hypothetical protein